MLLSALFLALPGGMVCACVKAACGSDWAHKEASLLRAFCLVEPSGNCCTQASALCRSDWPQELAMLATNSSRVRPGERVFANSTALLGSASANCHETLWSALRLAEPRSEEHTSELQS